MTDQDYRKALESAVQELEGLLEIQEETASRILSLRKTVNALSFLCEEAGEGADWKKHTSQRLKDALDSSITEDILSAVYTHSLPMTTTEIKNELEKIGTLDEHKNPLATINAVLNRLKEQGKVMDVESGGKRKWMRKLTYAIRAKLPEPVKPVK